MNISYNAVNEAQLTDLLAIKSNVELSREVATKSSVIFLKFSNLFGSLILFYPLIDNDRVRALLLILKIIPNFTVKNTQNCRFCDVIF